MPLFHNLTGDETEIGVAGNSVSTGTTNFDEKVKGFKNKVISDYERYKVDVNKSIAGIAENYHLNNEQIQRIIEEVNTHIYLTEYNKTRSNSERNVEFDIASLTKIKDLLGSGATANQDVKDDPENPEASNMDKKASADSELNFLNYSKYKSGSMGINTKYTETDITKSKLMTKIASEQKIQDKTLAEVAVSAELLSNSLIKYASMGKDTQSIFSDICHATNMKKSTQILVKEAMNKNIGLLKETGRLNNDFAINLSLVDFEDKSQSAYTLGEYSLNKKAEDIPTIEINNQAIKGLKKLINLADKIIENEEVYKSTSEKIASLNKELQIIKK